jgi:hypothetical protein
VLVPVLDGIRRFFDALPPGTVRRLLEAFLAWKVVSSVAAAVDALAGAYGRLAVSQAAVAGASVGGATVGPEVAVGNAAAQALGLSVAGVSSVGVPLGAAAYVAPRATFKQGGGGDPSFGTAPTLFGPASHHTQKPSKKKTKGIGRFFIIGDEASPRRGMLDMGQYVTSGYRTWGVGNDSDHAAGRAFDIAGPNLLALGQRMSRAGGYAAMHGYGDGRHLHTVPAGDTASPMRGGVGGSHYGDVNNIALNVYNPDANYDPGPLARELERVLNERDRVKLRRSPSG